MSFSSTNTCGPSVVVTPLLREPPALPGRPAGGLFDELQASLGHVRPLRGQISGVCLMPVTKPLPGFRVALALGEGALPYQFWVGLLDNRPTLAAAIEAPLEQVEQNFALTAKQLWHPGWDLAFKETPHAAGRRTLVTARCTGLPAPSSYEQQSLQPDILFPALDLTVIVQESLRAHQAARLPHKLI